MKLQKMKKLIKTSGNCELVKDASGNQWISDGRNWYAIEGMPELEYAHLPRMLDFEIDKWAEIFTDEVERLPNALDKLVERIREGYGNQLQPRECELKVNGRNLLLMSGGGHQIILRALALEPLTETDQMQYMMVQAGEKRIVVVMDGLFPVAIIREEELDNWILDVFNDLSTAVQGNAARQMRFGAEEEK